MSGIAPAKKVFLDGKVIIIRKGQPDSRIISFLHTTGFSAEDIEIHTNITSALAVVHSSVQLVLFRLDGDNNRAVVDALCFRFNAASVILLASPQEEDNASALLQYGAQDYILPADYASGRFRRTIGNALYRKLYANQPENMSDKRRIEERNHQLNTEIQQQKRQLDHILSSINEVVWSCDAVDFKTIYINDACYDIYGYTPEEIIGNCNLLFGRVHTDDKKHYKIAWRQLLQTGKSVFEYRIQHKDGTTRYIKNEAVLRRDHDHVPRFINGFARDVTVQKMQLQQIQSQNQQLQDIAWIQSHKVRGPVASILGLAQLFNTEKTDTANLQIMNHLQTAASNLDLVIRDIVSKSYTPGS